MSAPLFPRYVESTVVTRFRAASLRKASFGRGDRGSEGDWRTCPKAASEWAQFDDDQRLTDELRRGLVFPARTISRKESTAGATILRFPSFAPEVNRAPCGRLPATEPAETRWLVASPLRPVGRLLSGTRTWKAAAAAALLSTGPAAVLPPLVAYSTPARVEQELAPLVAARTAIWIRDGEGLPLGVLPQNGELGSPTGIRSPRANADFSRALRFLETRTDYFGISPQHLVRSMGCFGWRALWWGRREAQANCPGGSTLLMQASTQLRGGKANRGTIERKSTEIRDALALSVTLPPGYASQDQFIADNLPFGSAGGRSIVGVESASLILFGRSASALSLAQAVVLAATPKRQLALYCVQPSPQTLGDLHGRWTQIRHRAEHALINSFTDDTRVPEALAEIRAMPAHIRPAPLPPIFTSGMTPEAACASALDPVRRTELTDSSMRTIISTEIPALPRPNGLPIAEIQLATTIERQRNFKADVEASLRTLERVQRGSLLRSLLPGSGSADVLAFTADGSGALTGFYVSNGRGLAREQRRLGSQSKLAALLAFAAAGRSAHSILCNRAWNGLRNADGDAGFEDCDDPRAQVSLQTAFGRSLNLPILEELRRIDPAIIARAAEDAGFTDLGGDLPYAIAFGVAEATPLRVAATTAALSRGIAGQQALARVPRAIVRYRVGDQWLIPPTEWADLRHYFASERGRHLIAMAGGAPLSLHNGTLRAIATTGLQPGEVAKSGTDARADNLTFAKTAVGAASGRSWFAMVAAARGPVGRSGINIYALAATVRRNTLN